MQSDTNKASMSYLTVYYRLLGGVCMSVSILLGRSTVISASFATIFIVFLHYLEIETWGLYFDEKLLLTLSDLAFCESLI